MSREELIMALEFAASDGARIVEDMEPVILAAEVEELMALEEYGF